MVTVGLTEKMTRKRKLAIQRYLGERTFHQRLAKASSRSVLGMFQEQREGHRVVVDEAKEV